MSHFNKGFRYAYNHFHILGLFDVLRIFPILQVKPYAIITYKHAL